MSDTTLAALFIARRYYLASIKDSKDVRLLQLINKFSRIPTITSSQPFCAVNGRKAVFNEAVASLINVHHSVCAYIFVQVVVVELHKIRTH